MGAGSTRKGGACHTRDQVHPTNILHPIHFCWNCRHVQRKPWGACLEGGSGYLQAYGNQGELRELELRGSFREISSWKDAVNAWVPSGGSAGIVLIGLMDVVGVTILCFGIPARLCVWAGAWQSAV